MVSTITACELFVPESNGELQEESVRIANAMTLELMQYGYHVDAAIVARIASHEVETSRRFAEKILKQFTVGDLNPPLFPQWEDRTEFSFDELAVQILGYVIQLSGNDLADSKYMESLKDRIDFTKLQSIKLADQKRTRARFNRLLASKVALDKAAQTDLMELAKTYYLLAPSSISSAEARLAVAMGMVHAGMKVGDALNVLNAQPADAVRFAAAKLEFEGVKLPADVRFAKLKWSERLQLLSFLDSFSMEDLCEAMGTNRQAWYRFSRHLHLTEQSDFRKRFPLVVAAILVSNGCKLEAIPIGPVQDCVDSHSSLFDVTASGVLVFRTFAARVQAAVDAKDFTRFRVEITKRPTYLMRNLGAMSNVCTRETENEFVDLVRSQIQTISGAVLLSIIQIDVNAKYRIIDSKGNTTVTKANYHSVIGEIQGLAQREIYRRYGFPGQVRVQDELRSKVVPFLATNADLDRGTRIPFSRHDYLYFFVHWVQQHRRRTDLDHSFVCFDGDWKAETVYFGNQANAFIAQSGDITNAPAPHGATEYGRIDLRRIPKRVHYVVPIVNVYSGDVFSENEVAYAGFMFSDQSKFSIKREHVRYDLSQPANSNIPFVMDVAAKEIVVVDFNNRQRNGMTAHDNIGEIRKIISALKTKRFITIARFAKLLSGDGNEVSLTITRKGKGKQEIAPSDLHSLVNS